MERASLVTLAEAVERHRLVEAGEDLTSKFAWGDTFLQSQLGPAAGGRLVVVAARPTVGKSYFALRMATNIGMPALFVSLEDDVAEMGKRAQALPTAAQDRVLIATPSRALSKIKSTIAAAHEEAGVRLVVVDYLNRVRYDGEASAFNETSEIANTIGDLVDQAKELDFVLVLNAQIGRPPPGSKDSGSPPLWRLKGSASIEESAHSIIMLHELDAVTVEATIAKSKSTRKGGTQLYRRDSHTGWLVETETQPEDEGDELFS